MKLNFFLDVDGTLLPFGEGLPDSAFLSICKAKEEGHRFFVSTGRSENEMDSSLSVIDFDGGVYEGGARAVFKNEEIWRKRMKKEEVAFLMKYAKKKNFLVMIQCEEATFLNKEAFTFFDNTTRSILGHSFNLPGFRVVDTLPPLDVSKVIFLSKEKRCLETKVDLKDSFNCVDNTCGLEYSQMIEICMKGIDKATGIEKLLLSLGEGRESSVGIGDGSNDIEMLEYCGLGIAMGNGCAEIKKVASFVTDRVENDGLKKAIEYAINEYGKSL